MYNRERVVSRSEIIKNLARSYFLRKDF